MAGPVIGLLEKIIGPSTKRPNGGCRPEISLRRRLPSNEAPWLGLRLDCPSFLTPTLYGSCQAFNPRSQEGRRGTASFLSVPRQQADAQLIIESKLKSLRTTVADTSRDALPLIGFMEEPSARDFLVNDCILEKTPDEVNSLIRRCRDAVLLRGAPNLEARTRELPPEADVFLSEIVCWYLLVRSLAVLDSSNTSGFPPKPDTRRGQSHGCLESRCPRASGGALLS